MESACVFSFGLFVLGPHHFVDQTFKFVTAFLYDFISAFLYDFMTKVIKKCRNKFECLVYEMLWIKNKRPKLNTQADSIRAKLFTWILSC